MPAKCPECADMLCAGLYEGGHCHANEACGACQETENIAVEIAAKKLREIAEGKPHEGWFGGEEMDACARAIDQLNTRIVEPEAELRPHRQRENLRRNGVLGI